MLKKILQYRPLKKPLEPSSATEAAAAESISVDTLDHVIHDLYVSGELANISTRQMQNILYTLTSAGWIDNRVKPEQLDHVINDMRLTGELKKLSRSQIDNIIYSFKSLALLDHLKDISSASYDDGKLISFHPAEFLDDDRFMQAYQQGVETFSWVVSDFRWSVYILCWAAEYAKHLPGDFVEYGAKQGGFAKAQMHYIDFKKIPTKTFYLLDRFWQVISDDEIDFSQSEYYDKYFSFYEDVRQSFSCHNNVKMIKGVSRDACEQVVSEQICYLGINTFPAQSETLAIDFFWDRLVSGAVIVLGDYSSCAIYKRKQEYFQQFAREKNVKILALPTGQGLIIKP